MFYLDGLMPLFRHSLESFRLDARHNCVFTEVRLVAKGGRSLLRVFMLAQDLQSREGIGIFLSRFCYILELSHSFLNYVNFTRQAPLIRKKVETFIRIIALS